MVWAYPTSFFFKNLEITRSDGTEVCSQRFPASTENTKRHTRVNVYLLRFLYRCIHSTTSQIRDRSPMDGLGLRSPKQRWVRQHIAPQKHFWGTSAPSHPIQTADEDMLLTPTRQKPTNGEVTCLLSGVSPNPLPHLVQTQARGQRRRTHNNISPSRGGDL